MFLCLLRLLLYIFDVSNLDIKAVRRHHIIDILSLVKYGGSCFLIIHVFFVLGINRIISLTAKREEDVCAVFFEEGAFPAPMDRSDAWDLVAATAWCILGGGFGFAAVVGSFTLCFHDWFVFYMGRHTWWLILRSRRNHSRTLLTIKR